MPFLRLSIAKFLPAFARHTVCCYSAPAAAASGGLTSSSEMFGFVVLKEGLSSTTLL